jgi:hypothetical protein
LDEKILKYRTVHKPLKLRFGWKIPLYKM